MVLILKLILQQVLAKFKTILHVKAGLAWVSIITRIQTQMEGVSIQLSKNSFGPSTFMQSINKVVKVLLVSARVGVYIT